MLVQFSILPVGVGESLKDYVARVMKVIMESGLSYRVSAMSTVVEGDERSVMELIMRCHNTMKEIAPRVITSITIDDRKGVVNQLEGKIKDVEQILGKKLNQ